MQIRKLVYKCAMRLPKLATLCPLRKAKILGRAQFRHSATYKTIQLSELGSVIEVDACEYATDIGAVWPYIILSTFKFDQSTHIQPLFCLAQKELSIRKVWCVRRPM